MPHFLIRNLVQKRPLPIWARFIFGSDTRIDKNPCRFRQFCTDLDKGRPFPATYLIETLGFSPESAESTARRLNFEGPEQPDSVLAFFKRHGFSESQIAKIVRRQPRLLAMDPETNLLPKQEFFYSVGASSSDVAQIASSFPCLFARSLEKKLIPSFVFLTSIFESETEVIVNAVRFGDLLRITPETADARNLLLLRECGVPNEKLVILLRVQRRSLRRHPDMFREIVEEVREMGFNPKTTKFVLAVLMFGYNGKAAREKKVKELQECGWSEEEILSAFRRHPWCFSVSKSKVMVMMDYLSREMGLEPSWFAKYPRILSMSFQKRIVPRVSVAQSLITNGILSKKIYLIRLFDISEKLFQERFIEKYEKEVPGLSKLYQEKLGVAANPVNL